MKKHGNAKENDSLRTQAEEHLQKGDYKKAVILLKKKAQSDFADLRVRSLFGLAMARSDRSFYGFYRGLKWCGEAVKQKSDDPYLLVNLGKVYLYHGIRPKALEHLNQAMELAPEDSYALEARGFLGFRQRPKIPFLDRKNLINIILGKISVSIKQFLS